MQMTRLTVQDQARAGYRRRARNVGGREARLEPTAVEQFLALTHDDDPALRCEAARALCPCHVQADIDRVWDRLIEMARDPDPKVRASVLHALCDGSPHAREAEVVQAIESMYHDPDLRLRRHVRRVLATYRRLGKINIL
jgi:HEAT repeat protein